MVYINYKAAFLKGTCITITLHLLQTPLKASTVKQGNNFLYSPNQLKEIIKQEIMRDHSVCMNRKRVESYQNLHKMLHLHVHPILGLMQH